MVTYSSMIQGICQNASRIASNVRLTMRRSRTRTGALQRGIVAESARRRGARWLNQMSNRLLPILDRFQPHELDLLVGCLARVEHAIGLETIPFRRLKATAAARVGSILI